MLSLITVVHRPEIPYIKLQAKSIQQYFDPDYIQSIHVIVNDDDSVCDLVDKSWYGDLADRVNVTPRSMYGYKNRVTGWEGQQLCKLLAAGQVWSAWSMILDAKTFFVKDVTDDLLFTNGKVNSKDQEIYPEFQSAKDSVGRLFGLTLNKAIGPGGVPFLMHTDTVRELMNYTSQMYNTTFADFFQDRCQYPDFITEFYIYSGYVKLKYGNIRELYTNRQDWECVNLADSEINKFDEVFKKMEDYRTLTVSIKAKAWPLLTNEQRLKYVTLLKTRNIVDSIEDSLEQLNTVVIN